MTCKASHAAFPLQKPAQFRSISKPRAFATGALEADSNLCMSACPASRSRGPSPLPLGCADDAAGVALKSPRGLKTSDSEEIGVATVDCSDYSANAQQRNPSHYPGSDVCSAAWIWVLELWSLSSRSWSPHVGERVGEAGNPGPPRHKLQGVQIVSVNANAWSTARDLLRDTLSETHATLIQEHRLSADTCDPAQAAVRKDGWRVGFASAELTAASTSAGVAVAVPTHVGMEPSLDGGWDASPVAHPGRIARAWINIMGGITLYSIYMRCSEGWSPGNVQLARHLASLLRDTVGGLG